MIDSIVSLSYIPQREYTWKLLRFRNMPSVNEPFYETWSSWIFFSPELKCTQVPSGQKFSPPLVYLTIFSQIVFYYQEVFMQWWENTGIIQFGKDALRGSKILYINSYLPCLFTLYMWFCGKYTGPKFLYFFEHLLSVV